MSAEPAVLVLAPEGGGAPLLLRALSGHSRLAGSFSSGDAEQVDELAALHPGATVVHVVRDPRVAIPPQGPPERWLRETTALLRFGTANPERLVKLPYESLLNNPKPTCERLCEALDLPPEPEPMTAAMRAGLSEEEERVFQSDLFDPDRLAELERALQPVIALLGFRPATLRESRDVRHAPRSHVDEIARLRRERDQYAGELQKLRHRLTDDPQLPLDIDVLRWKAKRYDRMRAAAAPLRLLKRLQTRLRAVRSRANDEDSDDRVGRSSVSTGREGETAGLRVCIVAQRNLGRTTRVVRQAQALVAAGNQVTVVCRQRPVEELLATVPSVEWIEVESDPWTQRYTRLTRQRMRRREERRRRLRRSGRWAAKSASRMLKVTDALRDATRLVVVLPAAFLLRGSGESLRVALARLRRLDEAQLVHAILRPFLPSADSASFAAAARATLGVRAFDACQAHDNYALPTARAVAVDSGSRLIFDATHISEHRSGMAARSLLERSVDRRIRRSEIDIVKRSTAATVAISEGFADWYAKRYRIPRPTVIRNCRNYWDYQRRVEIRRDCDLDESEALVAWIGVPYPEQGIEAIVDAAEASRPNVHFALVADATPAFDAFYEGVKSRARARGVASRVHFLPGREPIELISYLSGADLGIIPVPDLNPHLRYSLPNKAFEMIMARLPLAVSNLPDLRALVEHYGIGRVFDREEKASIAAAIDALLAPNERGRLRNALEQAASELCWEKEGARYVEVVATAADSGFSAGRGRRGHSWPAPTAPPGR